MLAHFTPLSLCVCQGTQLLLLALHSHGTKMSTEGLIDKQLQSIQFQISSPSDPCSSASLTCTLSSTGDIPSHSSPHSSSDDRRLLIPASAAPLPHLPRYMLTYLVTLTLPDYQHLMLVSRKMTHDVHHLAALSQEVTVN